MLWDGSGEVIMVGCASVEDSTSVPVFGERIETGWEHRTLCKKRRDVGMPLPKECLTPTSSSGPLPGCLLSQFLSRDEGTWSLVEPSTPEKGFPCKIKLHVLDTQLCLWSLMCDLNESPTVRRMEGLIFLPLPSFSCSNRSDLTI